MWNEKQLKVLNGKEKETLVSASAGSGKTSVMVEKVCRLISEGLEVNRILMLTFTQAAAKEMKLRLFSALVKKAETQGDFLKEQADSVFDADIGTIDAFCKKLVKLHFDKLGISPDFSVMDEADEKKIFSETVKKLIKEKIAGSDKSFYNAFDKIAGGREDNFVKVISYIYSFASCAPSKEEWLDKCADNFKIENFDFLCNLRKQLIVNECKILKQEYDDLDLKLKNLSLNEKADYIKNLLLSLDKIINSKNLEEALHIKRNIVFEKHLKRSSLPEYASVNEEYKNFIDELKNLKIKSDYDLKQEKDKLPSLYELCNTLVSFTKDVDSLFGLYKEENGVYTFSDLEQFACLLLRDKAIQKEISSCYDYVFVDEFQDTNYSQDFIIENVSKFGKIFLVGDSKQSIYGFRQTQPEIFISKYRKFEKGKEGTSYILNENYRSSDSIIENINSIFSEIMTDTFGSINYRKEGKLVTGGDFKGVLNFPSFEISVIEKSNEKDEADGVYSVEEDKGSNEISLRMSEGFSVAEKILSLYGKKVSTIKEGNTAEKMLSYSDFAVLYQDRKEGAYIVKALNRAGIPTDSDITSDSDDREVTEVVNYLKFIYNPKNDIITAAAMLSNIGGFCEKELVEIRKSFQNEDFFSAVLKYSELDNSLSEKIKSFLNQADSDRIKSGYLSLYEFFDEILKKSGYDIYLLSLPGGEIKLKKIKNIFMSLSAKNFGKNLYTFIPAITENPNLLNLSAIQSGGDAVKCMTVHQSKGLEFPVVFLTCADKNFTFELNKSYLADANLKLAVKYFDEKERCYSSDLLFDLIVDKKRKEIAEEKLRLLYVALTRAQYHLFISGSYKEGEFSQKHRRPEKALSFMEWLSFAAAKNKKLSQYVNYERVYQKDLTENNIASFKKGNIKDAEIIEKILSFSYPYQNSLNLGIKYTVSEIISNRTDENHSVTLFSSSDAKEGTAYHKVMQYIDFSLTDEKQVKNAIENMVSENLLNQEEAELINPKDILLCITSPVVSLAKNANIKREFGFINAVGADSILENSSSDKILVQGVIDLCIFGDKTIIVDYKKTGKSKENIIRTYKPQLDLYAGALEKWLKRKVDEKYIYVFSRNLTVKID